MNSFENVYADQECVGTMYVRSSVESVNPSTGIKAKKMQVVNSKQHQ